MGSKTQIIIIRTPQGLRWFKHVLMIYKLEPCCEKTSLSMLTCVHKIIQYDEGSGFMECPQSTFMHENKNNNVHVYPYEPHFSQFEVAFSKVFIVTQSYQCNLHPHWRDLLFSIVCWLVSGNIYCYKLSLDFLLFSKWFDTYMYIIYHFELWSISCWYVLNRKKENDATKLILCLLRNTLHEASHDKACFETRPLKPLITI